MKTSYGWKLLPYLRPYRLRFFWALSQVFVTAGFGCSSLGPCKWSSRPDLGVRTKQPPRGGRFQETGNEAELLRALPAGSLTVEQIRPWRGPAFPSM
jgi:hypothetical protein